MSFLEGIMWLDGAEVFNNGRTRTNMLAARAAGLLPAQFFIEDCECDAYDLNPTIPTGPFTDFLACGPPCVTETMLNHITTENPWYDEDIVESSEFLGVTVHSVTGLDGRHNSRNTSPRLAYPRGSILSPLLPSHRTIQYEITLIATSSCGLDYGMQWLERQLGSAACTGCGLSEMTVRSCCPPADNPEYGIWTLKEVGLAEGPEWLDPIPSKTVAPYMRDATLAFYAGNPCRFSKPEECLGWSNQWDGSFPSATVTPYFRCCAISAPSKIYDYAPIITLEASDLGDSFPFTVLGYAGEDCSTASIIWNGGAPTRDPDFSIGVLSIPGGHRLVLDGSLRQIRFSGPWTDYEEIDGSSFIDATAGFVRWGDIGCEDGMGLVVSVDPDDLADAYTTYAADPASAQAYWPSRVRVDVVKRGGC